MMEKKKDLVEKEEMLTKIRAAIEDRATWFALLYEEFSKHLPADKVEELSRAAIHKYGIMKAKKDPADFEPKSWVIRHKEKGSADVFSSEIEYDDDHAVQMMGYCPLVESWKKLGLSDEKIDLYCDIAMDGDRGRADGHDGIVMELSDTIAKGCSSCKLTIHRE
jgi:L-2-amino-thiazoline-4-carboxylic acid hydrolase